MILQMMLRRFGQPFAVFFATMLAVAPVMATDLLTVPTANCGPGAALKAAGHSHFLVPQLQHKNGSVIRPDEVRTMTDKTLYLPSDARPDRAAYVAFIAAEQAKFGPSKGCTPGAISRSATTNGPPCIDQQGRIDELNKALIAASARADRAEAALKTAQDDLKKEQDKNHFPLWALLFLLVGPIGYFIGWRRRQLPDDGSLGLEVPPVPPAEEVSAAEEHHEDPAPAPDLTDLAVEHVEVPAAAPAAEEAHVEEANAAPAAAEPKPTTELPDTPENISANQALARVLLKARKRNGGGTPEPPAPVAEEPAPEPAPAVEQPPQEGELPAEVAAEPAAAIEHPEGEPPVVTS